MGFLGTDAGFRSDLTLLVYIFGLMPGMLLGWYFARRKLFVPQHKYTMTLIVIANWFLIGWLMLTSYQLGVLASPDAIGSDIRLLLPTIHLITGAISQLLATYLVLLMWTENTPFERIVIVRIKNIKTPMRITLGLWLTTIALGVLIYLVWYTNVPIAAAGPDPATTEEALVEPATTEEATAEGLEPEPATTEDAAAEETAAPEPATTEEADPQAQAVNEETAAPDPATTEETAETPEPVTTEEADTQAQVVNEETAAPDPATTEEATATVDCPTTITPDATSTAPDPAVTEDPTPAATSTPDPCLTPTATQTAADPATTEEP